MPSYTSIKKAPSADRQRCAASQHSNELARSTLSSALKSLLAYRKENASRLKLVLSYQGAGDESEEMLKAGMHGSDSDVIAWYYLFGAHYCWSGLVAYLNRWPYKESWVIGVLVHYFSPARVLKNAI
jgi:hypothetical protein